MPGDLDAATVSISPKRSALHLPSALCLDEAPNVFTPAGEVCDEGEAFIATAGSLVILRGWMLVGTRYVSEKIHYETFTSLNRQFWPRCRYLDPSGIAVSS